LQIRGPAMGIVYIIPERLMEGGEIQLSWYCLHQTINSAKLPDKLSHIDESLVSLNSQCQDVLLGKFMLTDAGGRHQYQV
jgi:hypothetical protein